MHLALACTARARWWAQCELYPRLAAADNARVEGLHASLFVCCQSIPPSSARRRMPRTSVAAHAHAPRARAPRARARARASLCELVLAGKLVRLNLLCLLVSAGGTSPPPASPAPKTPPCALTGQSCAAERCCSSPEDGCYKQPNSEHRGPSALCLPLTTNCTGHVSGLSSTVIEASQPLLCPGWETCAPPFGNCALSGCCEQPAWAAGRIKGKHRTFECFKKPGGAFYAQCRPTSGTCKDTADWLCPGWSECGRPWGFCTHSRCCHDEPDRDFGCFKRPDGKGATCRPLPAAGEACVDSDEWLCPGWDTCSGPEEGCVRSQCCNQLGFTCYAPGGKKQHARCMRTGSCESASGLPCKILDDSPPSPTAPPSPPASPPTALYRAGVDTALETALLALQNMQVTEGCPA